VYLISTVLLRCPRARLRDFLTLSHLLNLTFESCDHELLIPREDIPLYISACKEERKQWNADENMGFVPVSRTLAGPPLRALEPICLPPSQDIAVAQLSFVTNRLRDTLGVEGLGQREGHLVAAALKTDIWPHLRSTLSNNGAKNQQKTEDIQCKPTYQRRGKRNSWASSRTGWIPLRFYIKVPDLDKPEIADVEPSSRFLRSS